MVVFFCFVLFCFASYCVRSSDVNSSLLRIFLFHLCFFLLYFQFYLSGNIICWIWDLLGWSSNFLIFLLFSIFVLLFSKPSSNYFQFSEILLVLWIPFIYPIFFMAADFSVSFEILIGFWFFLKFHLFSTLCQLPSEFTLPGCFGFYFFRLNAFLINLITLGLYLNKS